MKILKMFKKSKKAGKQVLNNPKDSIETVKADFYYRTNKLAEELIDLKTDLEQANKTIKLLVHLLADKMMVEKPENKENID